MQGVPLQIPEKVRRRAELLGEAGHIWLADLPRHIAEIERRWALEVGQPFRNGTEAFVAEARTNYGQDVVLKMAFPVLILRTKNYAYCVPPKVGVMRS